MPFFGAILRPLRLFLLFIILLIADQKDNLENS